MLGGGDIVCGSSFKIGDNALSSGTVRVSGSGSTLSAQGDSRVGNLGSGSLAIESGGSVSVANLTVGDDSDGTLRVRGGSSLLTASGGVLIGNNAGSSGLLRLENGGRLTAPTLTVSEFGRAEGAGTVQASVLNGGVVRPGAPIGRLSVTGSYTQVGGLEIELSGFAAGSEYDQLSASGSVTLGGSLDVALTGGFNPGSGEFVVVQGGSISGSFATVTLPPDFEISYESTRVVVSRNSGCGADFNGDGSVNTQDVIAFLNAWSSGHASADMNGDGNINTQDVILFLNLWTAGC